MLLSCTGREPSRKELTARRMIERRVDGVAILTHGMQEELVESLRLRSVPMVLTDAGQRFPGTANLRIHSAFLCISAHVSTHSARCGVVVTLLDKRGMLVVPFSCGRSGINANL